MTHKSAKFRADKLFHNLERMSTSPQVEDGDEDTANIVSLHGQAVQAVADTQSYAPHEEVPLSTATSLVDA